MARQNQSFPKELSTTSITPTAYYKFTSGALTTDSSGNSHTLTAIGDPAEIAGKFGGGVDLDGNDAYSSVDHADFQPTGNFTVGVWIKTSTTGATQIIFQTYSENTYIAGIVLFIASTNKLRISVGKNTGTVANVDYKAFSGNTTITDGNWHFVVGVWDGSYLRLYVDGVIDTPAVAWANAPAYAATNYVRVGCINATGTNANFVTGQLDDVFLLNGTALTAAQIALLYNGRNPITQARNALSQARIPLSQPRTAVA
jgi:hypothetical protein